MDQHINDQISLITIPTFRPVFNRSSSEADTKTRKEREHEERKGGEESERNERWAETVKEENRHTRYRWLSKVGNSCNVSTKSNDLQAGCNARFWPFGSSWCSRFMICLFLWMFVIVFQWTLLCHAMLTCVGHHDLSECSLWYKKVHGHTHTMRSLKNNRTNQNRFGKLPWSLPVCTWPIALFGSSSRGEVLCVGKQVLHVCRNSQQLRCA